MHRVRVREWDPEPKREIGVPTEKLVCRGEARANEKQTGCTRDAEPEGFGGYGEGTWIIQGCRLFVPGTKFAHRGRNFDLRFL